MKLSLKYPVSKMQKRVKVYLLFSLIISFVQFLLIVADKNITSIITESSPTLTAKFFHENIGIVTRILTLVPYVCFIIIGSLSNIYLFVRFCRGKTFAKKLRNEFVLRHVMYVLCYTLIYFPVMFNTLLYIINKNSGLVFADVSIFLIFFNVLVFDIHIDVFAYDYVFYKRK